VYLCSRVGQRCLL